MLRSSCSRDHCCFQSLQHSCCEYIDAKMNSEMRYIYSWDSFIDCNSSSSEIFWWRDIYRHFNKEQQKMNVLRNDEKQYCICCWHSFNDCHVRNNLSLSISSSVIFAVVNDKTTEEVEKNLQIFSIYNISNIYSMIKMTEEFLSTLQKSLFHWLLLRELREEKFQRNQCV